MKFGKRRIAGNTGHCLPINQFTDVLTLNFEMENLGQIATISEKIKTASKMEIRALHRFIFQEDGDRGNRQRLRTFPGFEFEDGSVQHTAKINYANDSLSEGDLTSVCNLFGLEYDGSKNEVVGRICSGLMDLNTLKEDSDEEDADEGLSDEEREHDDDLNAQNNVANERRPVHFALNFKDVEDSIRAFDGSDSYPIERWIQDFEDAAMLVRWNDLQKVVFAKKSLKGTAKLFIQGESAIRTWKKLKGALEEEFSSKINSAELHDMLSKRKMKKDETVQVYFLIMKELANRGQIEIEAQESST